MPTVCLQTVEQYYCNVNSFDQTKYCVEIKIDMVLIITEEAVNFLEKKKKSIFGKEFHNLPINMSF